MTDADDRITPVGSDVFEGHAHIIVTCHSDTETVSREGRDGGREGGRGDKKGERGGGETIRKGEGRGVGLRRPLPSFYGICNTHG